MTPKGSGGRGFARMSPERRKLISQRGNARLREQGREHRFSSDEAREAVERKRQLDERRQEKEQDGHEN